MCYKNRTINVLLTVDYNLQETVALGGHNIVADPFVVVDNVDDFDDHLRALSPAIEAGLAVGQFGGIVPATDLEGTSRPMGSGVDIGAYEYMEQQPVNQSVRRIQEVYVAHYGRCAHPARFDFWVDQLNISNGSLGVIINAFGTSLKLESQYGALSSEELINTIYHQMFNRDPGEAGRTYYLTQLESGLMILADITLRVLDGAQNEDRIIVDNKVNVAIYATELIRQRGSSHTETDLAHVKAIFAFIGLLQDSVNAAMKAIDQWCQ